MLINRMNKTLFLSVLLAAVLPVTVLAQATVDQVTQEGEKRADAGAAEQRRIEQIANQTDDLLFTIRDFSARARGVSPSGIAMEPRSRRVASVTTPFFIGTLKSTRTRMRFPATSRPCVVLS